MNTIEKLNALAEYQAQIDLLNIQKQELLDQVQIPEEIQTIKAEGEKRNREIDKQLQDKFDLLNVERKEMLAAVVVPPEVQAIFDAVMRRRNQIDDAIQISKEEATTWANDKKAQNEAEFFPKINTLFAQIAQRKSEINTEFEDKTSGALDNIAKLTAEIKAEVTQLGESVKGTSYQAVYSKGRTTWKTDILDDVYFALNAIKALLFEPGFLTDAGALPTACAKVSEVIKSLEKARHVGEPSIAIRKI